MKKCLKRLHDGAVWGHDATLFRSQTVFATNSNNRWIAKEYFQEQLYKSSKYSNHQNLENIDEEQTTKIIRLDND